MVLKSTKCHGSTQDELIIDLLGSRLEHGNRDKGLSNYLPATIVIFTKETGC